MGKKRRIMSSNKFKSKNSYLADALSRTRELSDRVGEVAEAVIAPAPKVAKPAKPKAISKAKSSTTRRKSSKSTSKK